MFGDWYHDDVTIRNLQHSFKDAKPFEYVIIPNFLQLDILQQILTEFPSTQDVSFDWKHYNNPLEQKYALNKLDSLPCIQQVFEAMMSSCFLSKIQTITSISNLETDPHFHGAGLHSYPGDRGKLDIHLDYSLHPISGKERRCNLILYLNQDWKQEYGGELCLYGCDTKDNTTLLPSKEEQVKLNPSCNTAVLFRTSDVSFHGLPKPMQAPSSIHRKSLAIYYVSDPRPEATQRPKAQFFPHRQMSTDLPTDIQEKVSPLYSVRPYRLIQQSDLWEGWQKDGHGWW